MISSTEVGSNGPRVLRKYLVACNVELYTEHIVMPAEKTVAVSFRFSPRFKHLLEEAAARERRSQTNLLETLLFDYCEQRGIESAEERTPPTTTRIVKVGASK